MKKNDTAPCLPEGSIKPLGWRLRPHCPSPAPDFFPVSHWGSSLLLLVRARNPGVILPRVFNPSVQSTLHPVGSAFKRYPETTSSLPHTHRVLQAMQQDNDNPFLFSAPTSHPLLQGPPNAPQSPTQSVTTPPCLPLLFLCHSALAIAIAQTHLAPAGGLCPLCFLCMGFFLQTPPPPTPPGFGHLITWLRSPLFKLAAPPVPPHPLPHLAFLWGTYHPLTLTAVPDRGGRP